VGPTGPTTALHPVLEDARFVRFRERRRGALTHGTTLLLPYSCGDSTIRMALIDLPQLLTQLLNAPRRADAASTPHPRG
jgi:hypothetical protein